MKSANLKKMWFAKMTNVNGKVKAVAKLAETDKEKFISSPFKISALLWYLWFFSSFTQIQIWDWKSNSQINSIQFDSDGIFYQQNTILKVNFSKFPPRSTIMAHYVILCDVLPSVLYCKLTSSSLEMGVTLPSSLGINPVFFWSIPSWLLFEMLWTDGHWAYLSGDSPSWRTNAPPSILPPPSIHLVLIDQILFRSYGIKMQSVRRCESQACGACDKYGSQHKFLGLLVICQK